MTKRRKMTRREYTQLTGQWGDLYLQVLLRFDAPPPPMEDRWPNQARKDYNYQVMQWYTVNYMQVYDNPPLRVKYMASHFAASYLRWWDEQQENHDG